MDKQQQKIKITEHISSLALQLLFLKFKEVRLESDQWLLSFTYRLILGKQKNIANFSVYHETAKCSFICAKERNFF